MSKAFIDCLCVCLFDCLNRKVDFLGASYLYSSSALISNGGGVNDPHGHHDLDGFESGPSEVFVPHDEGEHRGT